MAEQSLPKTNPKPKASLNNRYDPERRFFAKVRKSEGCWLWTGRCNTNGYGFFGINNKMVQVHRYSFFLHYGYWPEPMCLHSCDNKRCVNPQHLRAGTNTDNVRDAISRGRVANNVIHQRTKLTEEQVYEIRAAHKNGILVAKDAAKLYGVSPYTIHAVRRRLSWRRLEDKP